MGACIRFISIVNNNQFPSPCVSISSTTSELLQWIKNKVGSGTIKEKKNYNTENHKNSYTYALRYNEAINLLQEISPYLVIHSKKERARLIIERYKEVTPRNGRYSKELLSMKEQFYEEFMKLK